MRTLAWLRKLLRDGRGNVTVIAAAAMPLIIGSAGFAVDTIHLSLLKRQLQRMADSSAIAGAHAIVQQHDAAQAVARDLQLNSTLPLSAPATVNNAPTSGAYAGNDQAVEVVLTTERRLPFFAFYTREATIVTARAVAARVAPRDHCLLALDPVAPHAIHLSGNATVDLGCGIASNSNADDSIKIHGNVRLSATELLAVGGADISDHVPFPEDHITTYGPRQIDPFGPQGRNLEVPSSPVSCDHTNFRADGHQEIWIDPGRYCQGIEIVGGAIVNFRPGVYIIDNGLFKIAGGATARGENVTFILTGNGQRHARLDWSGGAVIDLAAPPVSSVDPFGGILVFQDPLARPDGQNKIEGNIDLTMLGALYFPNQPFQWAGTATGSTRCVQIVARTIEIQGSASVPNDCPEGYGTSEATILLVRLVE